MQLGMDAQWDCFVAYPTARRATAEQLAELLLARGVRVFLDVLALQPGDNWPQAIPAALEDACVTVVLVAPETELAFYAQEEIAHAVARARGDEAHRRVVPVFLGATPDERVPYGLRIKQGYVVASPADLAHAADGIATLVEKITHQIELEADGEEPREVSPSARQHLATLRIQVEQLTRDQYRIINQLRFMRRVRISGCAGSGKTLVATEKATRLAKGGTRVLFLCHNPLLAEHVQQLTAGSGVEVRDFARWTAELAGDPPHCSATASGRTTTSRPRTHSTARSISWRAARGSWMPSSSMRGRTSATSGGGWSRPAWPTPRRASSTSSTTTISHCSLSAAAIPSTSHMSICRATAVTLGVSSTSCAASTAARPSPSWACATGAASDGSRPAKTPSQRPWGTSRSRCC